MDEHQHVEPAHRLRSAAQEIVITVVPAVLLALFINVFIVEAAVVENGPRMEPNLYRGYRLVTEKASCRFDPPERGDVVIANQPEQEMALIKRVVALPGETEDVR